MQREIMYNISSVVIVVVLFLVILLAYEVCYRLGRRQQQNTDHEVKVQANAIQAGILGLLALLLGFTFNMALQRFDNRSNAVISEANAIGTAMLRTKLLPPAYDSMSTALLHRYVDLRISMSSIDLTQIEERQAINKETDELQSLIWDKATEAAEIDPRPVTTGYYINSLNTMIDARGERNAILQQHVPEVILFLLFIVFIIGGGLMGYTSGLVQERAYVPTIMFTLLIVLVVFIIIDLDRPKRGVIKVNQSSLIELQSTVALPQE